VSRRPVKRQRERREKPKKRQRIPSRATRAQVHYIKPDPAMPYRVKVYMSPTRLHMRTTIRYIEGSWKACDRVMGMVCSSSGKAGGRQIVARMFLNTADLRRKGMEIITHECTHAGMAWVRLRRTNLGHMPGEEVLCYAVGRMAQQVNRIGQMLDVWQ
jgi:hypothetical protein